MTEEKQFNIVPIEVDNMFSLLPFIDNNMTKYKITLNEYIGHGGTGKVYSILEDEDYVVKIFEPKNENSNENYEVYSKEVNINQAIIKYNNISNKPIKGLFRPYFIGLFDTSYYLPVVIMQRYKKLDNRNPKSKNETFRFFKEIIRINYEVRKKLKIYHCDNKLENIMLDKDGNFILIDFSLFYHKYDNDVKNLNKEYNEEYYLFPKKETNIKYIPCYQIAITTLDYCNGVTFLTPYYHDKDICENLQNYFKSDKINYKKELRKLIPMMLNCECDLPYCRLKLIQTNNNS